MRRYLEEPRRRRFKGFDRIESTEENIKHYKKQFQNLSHVKTGHDFDGVILLDDDKFVAVLQCNIKTSYIVALEVSGDYRRQGIAKALLQLANGEFECSKLTVNKKNSAAISLYEKFGYTTFKDDGVMLYMEKK